MPARRFLALAAALVLGCPALVACDRGADDTTPDAADAAVALARGLAAGDLGDVRFAGTTPTAAGTAYDAIVAGMGEVEPRVEAAEVMESGERGTATLTWTWPLGADDWTYEAPAALTRTGDTWRVRWAPTLVEPSLADGEVLDTSRLTPTRGDVTGAGGATLVTARPVVRVGIDRARVRPAAAAASARRLAGLVGIDVAGFVRRVRASGPRAFVEAIVYRRGDVPASLAGLDRIAGATALPDELPLAPTREFAAPILGTVGEVTAEMVKEHPDTYRVGDVAGLSGLQARYDDRLRGTPGTVVQAVPEADPEPGAPDTSRELFRVDATPGRALRTTLDPHLQAEAERILADVGPASALVALRPSTGAVLAAANGPGNDGYNLATFGQLAPGSTFKSVTSLALLRDGLTPSSVVPCTSGITVDGRTFTNYSDYPAGAIGRIPLRTALANSCNTAFISQADRLGPSALGDAAAALGLGVDHDLGFPAYFGSVPPAGSPTEAAADMIGQGKVLASPLAMATVIGSVQAGHLVVPRLLPSVEVEAPSGVRPVSRAEAATLRGLLRGVVTSGSGRGLLDVPGPPVIAKTGTAEFERDGRVLTHAWMIAARGDLAVAAFVDTGESGSGTAGPLLEAFLRAAPAR
jgi:hypothetical protein